MGLRIAFVAAAVGLAAPLSAQPAPPVGHYRGVMVREGAPLTITLEFTRTAAGLGASWSAPELRALGVPLQRVAVAGATVTFALVGDQSSTEFEGTLHGDSLTGRFTGGEGRGTFAAVRGPKPVPPYREVEVTFAGDGVRLAGTLLLPEAPGRHPAMVFIHGSGGEGRAGARYLASEAASRGVVALIYDKRGVGGSTGDWRYATLDDLAADALAGVALLRKRPEVVPALVGVYGHSQGGSVAAVVAARAPDLAFAIAAASYGGPGYEQDLYRVRNALAASPFTPEERDEAFGWYRRFVEVIRTGTDIDAFERDLALVQSKPAIQWLGLPPRDHYLWKTYPPIGNFTPLPLWERVTTPVLLVYGEEDRVVEPGVSLERIGRALDRAGNTRWGAVVLPRASHPFMVAPRPGEPFRWPVVAPGLGAMLIGWVLATTTGHR